MGAEFLERGQLACEGTWEVVAAEGCGFGPAFDAGGGKEAEDERGLAGAGAVVGEGEGAVVVEGFVGVDCDLGDFHFGCAGLYLWLLNWRWDLLV